MGGRSVGSMQTIAANTATTTTEMIDLYGKASGMVYIPTGSSITTITWWVELDGNYYEAQDVDAQTVAADECFQIPTGLYGAYNLIPVTNASGTIYVTTVS